MNTSSIFIRNTEELNRKMSSMKARGADGLHILADFDRTLSKANVDGKQVKSAISILRDEGYLGEEYSKQAQALFDHYHPIEIDQTLSKEEKSRLMVERRNKHFEILKEYGLTLEGLDFVAEHGRMRLREHSQEMFVLLSERNVPMVIMSASVLGIDSIDIFLRKQNVNMANVHIISNNLTWDESGKMTGREEPIIHSLNKSEVVLHAFPEIYEKVRDRKNVILLGDSPHDLDMLDGFEADNCVSIGFCNNEDQWEMFKTLFDIVISNDGDMAEVNRILKEMIG